MSERNVYTICVQFTTTGGVTVLIDPGTSKGDARSVRISVQDTGPGLSEKEVDTLFRPFARVSCWTYIDSPPLPCRMGASRDKTLAQRTSIVTMHALSHA